jgi:vitamin K-dependent gamma-carboxylase
MSRARLRDSLAQSWSQLAEPVDRSNIEFFRIVFGAVMVWEVCRYLAFGWVDDYSSPAAHLHYPFFEWVQPLPTDQLVVFFIGMGILGSMICIGFLTRLAAIAFCVGFVYWFNLEATDYLNHLYLVGLLSFLVAVLPLGRSLSIDALLFPRRARPTAPRWTLEILRWQVGLVYFFGGVAKLNPDWLQAQPMLDWLDDYCLREWPGELIAQQESAWAISYGGLLLDLVAFPLLMWRRSRVPIAIFLVGFHLSNDWLFQIGIFPWLMMGALLLYMDPDWFTRLRAWVLIHIGRSAPPTISRVVEAAPSFRGPSAAFFSLWIFFQVAIPLRHFLYSGNPSWTEEGHWFSWHMKLRSKQGDTVFFIEDLDTGEVWPARLSLYFDSRQRRKLQGHPEWIRQTAGHLARFAAEEGHPNVAVTVDAWASLNGRPFQRMIDPDVDLSRISYTWRPADWIIPLDPELELDPEPRLGAPCP